MLIPLMRGFGLYVTEGDRLGRRRWGTGSAVERPDVTAVRVWGAPERVATKT